MEQRGGGRGEGYEEKGPKGQPMKCEARSGYPFQA